MIRAIPPQFVILSGAAMVLAACDPGDPREGETVEPGPTATASPVSIIRPDLEEAKELPLDPLEMVIGFGDGGTEFDEEAAQNLQAILDSPQYATGGMITLRGHTDSAGSDEANLRASQERAEAVRDHLLENGASEDRFAVIAIGEQNPIEPNALPDGSPNEEGRRANRRVEVTVAVPSDSAESEADAIDVEDAIASSGE